jgi:hypothetical protein
MLKPIDTPETGSRAVFEASLHVPAYTLWMKIFQAVHAPYHQSKALYLAGEQERLLSGC